MSVDYSPKNLWNFVGLILDSIIWFYIPYHFRHTTQPYLLSFLRISQLYHSQTLFINPHLLYWPILTVTLVIGSNRTIPALRCTHLDWGLIWLNQREPARINWSHSRIRIAVLITSLWINHWRGVCLGPILPGSGSKRKLFYLR